MGRPYHDELRWLPKTFRWALKQPVEPLCKAILNCSTRPILAIGSGGSAAAADYLATVHTALTGCLSSSQTPFEFVRACGRLDHSSVWLLSAGGGNVDIRRTMRYAIDREPAHLAFLCATPGSATARAARSLSATILEYESPAGKDGFLATNSLATFLLLICRAYSEILGKVFPPSLDELFEAGCDGHLNWNGIDHLITPLIDRESWIVAFDPMLKAVATDLESRFSEAALGSILPADIRNFAHGRHHWIAKRESSTAVLMINPPASAALARNTLRLIPDSTPKAQLSLSDDLLLAPIAGIFATMKIAGLVGMTKGIDPGRPGVPRYGSHIYNLATPPISSQSKDKDFQSIRRKVHQPAQLMSGSPFESAWTKALATFRDDLYRTNLRGIVFDYDGTLVNVSERFQPPNGEIVAELVRLLSLGVRIGIATGRGKSVRRDLRAILPETLWPGITIGYHNGAEIADLQDDSVPATSNSIGHLISACRQKIEQSKEIAELVNLDATHSQLSIQWKKQQLGWKLLDVIKPLLTSSFGNEIQLVSSGHSVDVLPADVSKRNVIEHMQKRFEISDSEILAIGDQGWFPGNDHALLSHRPSLSVDEVPADLDTCWRLTPPLVKGVPATLWYLRRLVSGRKKFTIRFKNGSLSG